MSVLTMWALMIPALAAPLDGFGLTHETLPERPASMKLTTEVAPDGTVEGGQPQWLVPWDHGAAGALESRRFYDEQGRVYHRADVRTLLASHDGSAGAMVRHDRALEQARRWKGLSAATFWVPGLGFWTVNRALDHHAESNTAFRIALRDFHVFGQLDADLSLVDAD